MDWALGMGHWGATALDRFPGFYPYGEASAASPLGEASGVIEHSTLGIGY
ncbi:MAG: hypothetical protein V7K92_03565 [Nostoc sp.]